MITYEDRMRSGSVTPRMYLVKGGVATKFDGKSIEGLVLVVCDVYKPNGKWSGTTYTLELCHGVRTLELCSPMHGIYGEHFKTWDEACQAMGLPLEEAKRILGKEYKKTFDRLEEIEKFFALETSLQEVVVVRVFDIDRRITPQAASAISASGKEIFIAPGEKGWYTPVVKEGNGKIVAVKHTSIGCAVWFDIQVAV